MLTLKIPESSRSTKNDSKSAPRGKWGVGPVACRTMFDYAGKLHPLQIRAAVDAAHPNRRANSSKLTPWV